MGGPSKINKKRKGLRKAVVHNLQKQRLKHVSEELTTCSGFHKQENKQRHAKQQAEEACCPAMWFLTAMFFSVVFFE